MGEEVSRAEITKLVLKMVAVMRGQAEELLFCPQLKDWTKEELQGTADLLLEDLREDRKEAIDRLQKLYQETNGEPFKGVHYAR